ncbi:GNAT family N-acetyltransferase [Rhodococcus sp. Eu-32]|uniref:GNAT family N-acetyltransferase n=1 Tax=Rhodococcus sp. Eu-32 TaxID=1017319 RepID=UPI000DF135F1|nr:GNAT family N-acetyltransferase [Rhodococcus sp. Eu-32]RRQ28877.1 GNAT family N-acetyltransferase [Rhodococcus sp. Eu-32]
MTVTVGVAGLWEAEQLADVAAVTFPLACPPGSTRESIDAFVADVLSHERFGDYLSDPGRTILAARENDSVVGYAMLVHGDPADPALAAVVAHSPTMELSKLYVLPGHHGGQVARALMTAALEHASATGCAGVWLGVNQENARAQRFYAKNGFEIVGTKTFTVGTEVHDDYVMERAL